MNILFVSNFYPPHTMGGYEIHCALKASRLAARGHKVRVLTSIYGGDGTTGDPISDGIPIDRRLPYASDRRHWRLRQLWEYEWRGTTAARTALRSAQTDVIYVWNMWWMPLSTLLVLQQSGIPIVYQIDHNWMLEWVPDDPWLKRWRPGPGTWKNRARELLRPALRHLGILTTFEQIETRAMIFVSRYRRNEHVAKFPRGAPANITKHVIYNGIDIPAEPRTPNRNAEYTPGEPLRLLYVSRYLTPAKGIDTVLQALDQLRTAGHTSVRLDVFGEFFPGHDAFQAEVSALAEVLAEVVTLHGALPRADLLPLYAHFDALVFASKVAEGLPLTLVEALAHGLPVIGTPVGGAAEAMPQAGSLTYPPRDAVALAENIRRLCDEPGLLQRLSIGAFDAAQRRFDLARTVVQTEDALLKATEDTLPT